MNFSMCCHAVTKTLTCKRCMHFGILAQCSSTVRYAIQCIFFIATEFSPQIFFWEKQRFLTLELFRLFIFEWKNLRARQPLIYEFHYNLFMLPNFYIDTSSSEREPTRLIFRVPRHTTCWKAFWLNGIRNNERVGSRWLFGVSKQTLGFK